MSGITLFINQQARYRNFDNVYAAIAMIGIIGLSTDMFLAWLGGILFPWKRRSRMAARGDRWAWLAWFRPSTSRGLLERPRKVTRPVPVKPDIEYHVTR
jgi:NitT/TauT family transport system permease protein